MSGYTDKRVAAGGRLLREAIAISPLGHISQAAQDAIDLRWQREAEVVWLIFNELPIAVRENATVDSVCAEYDRLRREHHYGEHCSRR